MNLTQIQYLLDTANSHSIHKTAEKHNISPQGASKAIKTLEQELGVALIERSTKGVFLTEDGEQLLGCFEQIQQLYKKIQNYCDEQNAIPDQKKLNGEIRLAVTPRFADNYLWKVLTNFKDMYPAIKIKVDSMSNDKIFEKMQNKADSFDMAIVTITNLEPNIEQLSNFLMNKKLCFISFSSKNLYMCGLKEIIKKIGDVFIVNACYKYSVVAYEYGGVMAAYRADYEYQVDSISAQINLINHQNMIGAYALDEFQEHFNSKKYAYIPFDVPVMLTYGSLMSSNHQLSEAEKAFLQFMYDYFKE